jgi:hypothetical protein
VSGFNTQQVLFVNNMAFSGISVFYANKGIERRIGWYDELTSFYQLVVSRKGYLDTLPSLGENWISGNSTPPSRAVIEKSKMLLDAFNSYLVQKKQQGTQIDVPKLVMGPIPAGGIGVEFHANSENALYVSIFNNETVEIELKHFDFYSTIEPIDPKRGVIAGYELLSGKNRNSGW